MSRNVVALDPPEATGTAACDDSYGPESLHHNEFHRDTASTDVVVTTFRPGSATPLHQFIAANLCAVAFGVVASLAAYFLVLASPWMFVLTASCVADGLVVCAARQSARRGDLSKAVTMICAGTWMTAVLVTLVTPQALPVMILAALLPVVFAEPYVARCRLQVFTLITGGCILALAALSRLQEVSGLPRSLPGPLDDAVVIGALPATAGLILVIVLNNAATLRDVAATARCNAAAVESSRRLLAEHAAELTASRSRLVAATDQERRRLERDLHDGAQQHLVALAVLLQLARTAEPGDIERLLSAGSDLLRTATQEIRRLAHGIYPPLLISGGLEEALPAAGACSPLPVLVDVGALARFPAPVETAFYYCCTEALQNAAKHGGPGTTAVIAARGDDSRLTLTVADTGRGFTLGVPGTGLTNMRDRLAAIGGTVDIDTAPGRGTRITASVEIDSGAT